LAGVLLAGALVFVRCVYAFLSPNAPLPSEVLVVEWWLPDTALRAAADEFKRGNYRCTYLYARCVFPLSGK